MTDDCKTLRASRDDSPKLLKDMTDAEIGALVRAKNEGKVIEFKDGFYRCPWTTAKTPTWLGHFAYRIRPEPKVETVTLTGGIHDTRGFWCFGADRREDFDTHRITLTIIDGVVQPTATVEAL